MVSNLTQQDGELLVSLARQAVEEYLRTGKAIAEPQATSPNLHQPCGAFDTIKNVRDKKKELRGCIGYPYPTTRLVKAVIECAISSATQDPRFPPVSLVESNKVVFEISVLTPATLLKVEDPRTLPSRIEIGKDGLIVERGSFRGLLLPQVPVECKWGAEEFLCNCCIKAGLPPDCWLSKATKISKFQARVFEEERPRGMMKLKRLGGK
jgi:uncharacterized protein (TIGR00296 family)